MDKRNVDGEQSSKEFTEVITRNIRPGHEMDYDDWLRRFMISERQFPGYLGTTVIAPGGNVSSVRYIINRFANQASLNAWENSEESSPFRLCRWGKIWVKNRIPLSQQPRFE